VKICEVFSWAKKWWGCEGRIVKIGMEVFGWGKRGCMNNVEIVFFCERRCNGCDGCIVKIGWKYLDWGKSGGDVMGELE
jgi:hypothetical protein